MWDQVKKLPPILVGQSLFSFLNLKSIIVLEVALVSYERRQTLSAFLSFFSKVHIEVDIPSQMTKLNWIQAHDFPITKCFVHLDMIKDKFEANMINEIVLISNSIITRSALDYLLDSFYERVVYIRFEKNQDLNLMEELFSRLHNLRALWVSCKPDGWILPALRRLHRETKNNVLIEKIEMLPYELSIQSIAEIVEFCPRLQSLSAPFDITEDSLIALSTYCPSLKTLNINFIPRVSTEESAALCAPALSCIHSIWTSTDDNNDSLVTIPYLTELKSLCANSYHDHVLLPLISQHCLKLDSIDISEFSSVTLEQLQQLAQNCSNLQSIVLRCYTLYSDEVFIGLVQYCPNLQKLSLWNHISTGENWYEAGDDDAILTDTSLLALSEHCPLLQELDAYGSFSITQSAVEQLIQQCQHLCKIELCAKTVMFEGTVLGVPVVVNRYDDGIVEHIIHIDR